MSGKQFPGEQIHLVKELWPFFSKWESPAWILNQTCCFKYISSLRMVPFTWGGSIISLSSSMEMKCSAMQAHFFHWGVNYARIRSNKRQRKSCKWEIFSIEVSWSPDQFEPKWPAVKTNKIIMWKLKIQVKKQQILNKQRMIFNQGFISSYTYVSVCLYCIYKSHCLFIVYCL